MGMYINWNCSNLANISLYTTNKPISLIAAILGLATSIGFFKGKIKR